MIFGRQPIRVSGNRRDLMLAVQIGGLLVTSWIVWSVSLQPRLDREPLSDLILQVLSYTLLVYLSAAVITLGLYLLVARSFDDDTIRMALRTSGTAVWFAAATILLEQMSPASLPAALVLIVSTTRLLYSQWRLVHPGYSAPSIAPLPCPFFDPTPAPRLRELIPGLAASFALQTGLIAFADSPLFAASLFCLSVSMLTLCGLQAGAFEVQARASLPRSILGFLLTFILAAGLTVGSVAQHLDSTSVWHSPFQRKPGPIESARAVLHKLFEGGGDAPSEEPSTTVFLPATGNVEITDNSFPGVVLLSPKQPQLTVLIAPALPSIQHSPDAAPVKPFTIPFSGEYWMYRSPYTRPPRTSHVAQGNPVTLSFRTTDHKAMEMEAHQKLARALSLDCCSEIRVTISNADRYPGTVALELQLLNSIPADPIFLSLGKAPVNSRPYFAPVRGATMPRSEILSFAIPQNAELREFDEIKVIFHRDRLRAERSARISIDNFQLVPRGN